MVAGLAVCMFIQLKFLNNGLRLFDILFMLPIYQAFWITGATVNGILFFEVSLRQIHTRPANPQIAETCVLTVLCVLLAPCSLVLGPCSLLLAPWSLLLAPCSLLLAHFQESTCVNLLTLIQLPAQEYANFNDTQFYMFPIGCVLTVGGVAALAMKYEQSEALDTTASLERQRSGSETARDERAKKEAAEEEKEEAATAVGADDVALEIGKRIASAQHVAQRAPSIGLRVRLRLPSPCSLSPCCLSPASCSSIH